MFYIYTQSLQNSESTLACNRRSLFDFGPSFAPAVSNFPECDLTGRCCLNDLKGLFRPLFPGLEDLDWRSFGFLDGEVSDLLWGPVICFLLLDLLLCWVFAAIGGPLRSLLVPSVECIMWVLILSPLGFCEGFWKLKPCMVSRVGMETDKEIRQKWAVNRVNTMSSPGFELALAHGEIFEFQWIRILGSIILRHLGKLYAIEWVVSGQYMENL